MMHVSDVRPACFVAVAAPRPWLHDDLVLASTRALREAARVEIPPYKDSATVCKTWHDRDRMDAYQGGACRGCARYPWDLICRECGHVGPVPAGAVSCCPERHPLDINSPAGQETKAYWDDYRADRGRDVRDGR